MIPERTERSVILHYKTKGKTRPPCFGDMHSLDEAEMATRCLPCRSFNDCKRLSPSAVDGVDDVVAADMIPRQPDVDKEYRVKW